MNKRQSSWSKDKTNLKTLNPMQ